MPDYKNAKIYKVVNSINDKVYIGSTTRTLAQRMGDHRKCAKGDRSRFYKAMRWHGVANFRIEIIRSFPCANVIELEKEEYRVIKKMLRRDVKLYNSLIDGKHTARTRKQMGDRQRGSANHNYGRFGALSPLFKRGSVSLSKGNKAAWKFEWCENGKRRSKSFGIKNYGHDEAKQLAEEYRNKIYPIE